ncbi:hypothetical protein BUALT_Bualt01G0186600 [Buddleja alternifolia]|uniref:Uncharacterized protein n=1 Tax=Buddleja alternifolia TaxID=168488 RepID=A0AAV6YEQ2_9LAMI|nr:hypothetical protein BUALT_Bualt01G0186600 [Buddleja alternifolia]
MAPRKRTSSGGKKSIHQNKEQLQQPSQPPKFGIQHFFDRHSESQKTLSQDNSKRNNDDYSRNRNPCNDLNHGDDVANLGKIESIGRDLRGGNARNDAVNSTNVDSSGGVSANGIDADSGSSGNGFSVGVVDFKRMKIGGNLGEVAYNPSHDTPTENLLPVVIDDDEKNQLEVSPEASKSASVKRFKFSPGMLIKQSQDDVIDEVTWKISPVNERLHAMSKHLQGKMRVLADSSRFNSMNFQQCSQKKAQTSPGISGKLEKWLSSPPLKADKKSLICSNLVTSRNVNPDHDVNCHGNNRNINSNDKSEVLNTQSPFSTPPSLSCCHDKALDDVDSNGAPDQLGSRQHKKLSFPKSSF